MMELVVAIIKPDAIERGLASYITNQIEESGLRIISITTIQLTEELIRAFQPVLNQPSEFGEEWKYEVIAALMKCPVNVLLIEGEDAMSKINKIKQSIRKQYSPGEHYFSRIVYNLLHTTNSSAEVDNHLGIFFPDFCHHDH